MDKFEIQVVDKPTSWAWKCQFRGKLYGNVITTDRKEDFTKERIIELGTKGMERVVAFMKKWNTYDKD